MEDRPTPHAGNVPDNPQRKQNPFADVTDILGLSAKMKEQGQERSMSTDRWDIGRVDLSGFAERVIALGASGIALKTIKASVVSGWAQEAVRQRHGDIPRLPDGTPKMTDDYAVYALLPHELATGVVNLADEEMRMRRQSGFGDMHDTERIKRAKTYLQVNR